MNNKDQMTGGKHVDIPDNVFIECPKANKKYIRVQTCAVCEYHRGLKKRFKDDRFDFRTRYMVVCTFPMARMIVEMEL